jgi:hypothetical protein
MVIQMRSDSADFIHIEKVKSTLKLYSLAELHHLKSCVEERMFTEQGNQYVKLKQRIKNLEKEGDQS